MLATLLPLILPAATFAEQPERRSASSAASAENKDPSLRLFDADSLAGWQYGDDDVHGWTMANHTLTANRPAAPLVSGWSWGDVEMTFRWKTGDDGKWRLRLLPLDGRAEKAAEPQSGDGSITISLSEGEAQNAIADGATAMTVVAPRSADGWHDTVLRRRGNQVTLSVKTHTDQGEADSSLTLATQERRLALEIGLASGSGAIEDLRASEPSGKPLFNGRDLSGWWTPGNLQSWQVQRDSVVCVSKNGNYLRTERDYADFTLSLEYKMAKGGNSGIGIRTARDGWPSGDGMELQLYDEPPGTPLTRHSTMAIYGNLEPLARADLSEKWNRVVVKAEGPLISAWVNGELVQHANTAALPELRRRHPRGWIGLQDHNDRIEFRDVRVSEIPEGAGLRQWRATRPQTASQLVLEPLMNSELLATDRGLRSETVTTQFDGRRGQTVVDLTGPGAVVEISRDNNAGQLLFFFDEETSPSITCPSAALHQHVPLVGPDAQPLLTFLPFRRRLVVKSIDGRPTAYRFDYVTFPASVPVDSFSQSADGVSRGLLPALSYRADQLSGGTHREADPLPRERCEPKTIAAGQRETLITLAGAGTVEWTKITGLPDHLIDDQLWLEMTVDGEAAPAIACPVRYFFPGLRGGNYHNFVVLDRGGWTNLLAMPYSSGLTVAVSNRGARPLGPIGATVSYHPRDEAAASDQRSLPTHRLRGDFATETDPPDRAWITQSGKGRLVGLVTDYGKAVAGVASLSIDGDERAGWQSSDWRAIIGMAPRATDERHALSGRQGGLQWRFFLLAPVEFERSFVLKAGPGPALGKRLALFYMQP